MIISPQFSNGKCEAIKTHKKVSLSMKKQHPNKYITRGLFDAPKIRFHFNPMLFHLPKMWESWCSLLPPLQGLSFSANLVDPDQQIHTQPHVMPHSVGYIVLPLGYTGLSMAFILSHFATHWLSLRITPLAEWISTMYSFLPLKKLVYIFRSIPTK